MPYLCVSDVLVKLLGMQGISLPKEKLQLMRSVGFSRAFLEDAFSNPQYSSGWFNFFRQDVRALRKTVNVCRTHFGDKITQRILMKLSNPEIQSARGRARLSLVPAPSEIDSFIAKTRKFHKKRGKPIEKFPAFFSTHLNTILIARSTTVEFELMKSMWKHKIERLKAYGLQEGTIQSWLKSGTKRVIRWFDTINPEQIDTVRRTLLKHHLSEIFPVVMSANMRGTLNIKEAGGLDARLRRLLEMGKEIGIERARRILAQQPHFLVRDPVAFQRLISTKKRNQPRKQVKPHKRSPRRPR